MQHFDQLDVVGIGLRQPLAFLAVHGHTATRVLAAAGAALYTPTANAVATSLVEPERRGRAIAVVMGGLTVATALGVPLGTWIGRTDWRLTMWLVTALASRPSPAWPCCCANSRTPSRH
ncbi:MFS transporter [Streptomyces sp. NPDC088253]|uniref:MFS transporter n=1 Tax=Streptomyces sp. NPDC088253 TaxID=3365846 RepID=UPI00380DE3A4